MLSWIPLVIDIITALPNLIRGVETAFSSQPKSGPSKWISVETSLGPIITSLANELAKNAPDKNVQDVAAKVSVFTKAVNDAIVAFYNAVGWPSTTTTS